MSSSLQNIPNGMSIYHSTTSQSGSSNINRNNRFQSNSQHQQSAPSYPLYETKSSTNINQKSLSPIMRDSSLSSRELNSGGYLKSASPPTTINNNNSYQNAIYVQKQQFYNSANKFSRENTPSGTGGLNRSGGGLSTDSPYGTVTHQSSSGPAHIKQAHHNVMTSSDTNLSKLFDRIHSSDESVCSSSSRDLNLSSSQHNQFQTYGTSGARDLNKSTSGSSKQLNIWNDYQPTVVKQQPIYNDVMSSHSNNNNGSGFIPKKQQRGHKDKDEIVKAKPYNIQQNW